MCGRFTLRAKPNVVAEVFELFDVPPLEARYNIAPTQPVGAVRRSGQAPGRRFVFLRWGLVPAWADDLRIGSRMINARSETAADKPAFRAALRERRCLILADGYYEWQHQGRQRQPFYIRMQNECPFGFAGLWERWERAGQSIESCTILTTAANELVRPIHDRMPVIVAAGDYDLWLDPAVADAKMLAPFFRPYPSQEMTAYPVGTAVNNSRNEVPECVARVG